MRGTHAAVAASTIWVLLTGWFASRSETWIAIWRFYCNFISGPSCVDSTNYLVVRWPVVAVIIFGPVALGWLIGLSINLPRRRRP
jgi:hypothetical protein